MGIANRDASLLTMQRRNKAENAYYNDWKAGVTKGNVALTSPAKSTAEVLTEVKLGCTACTVQDNVTDKNLQRYPVNFSSGKDTSTS